MRDGVVVPLTPKAFDLLVVLVRNSGHVLEKKELLDAVWPDSFVEEGNLAQHVSILRRTLGERSGEPQYIQTVPRRGYRFITPVREPLGCDAEAAGEPVPRISKRSARRWVAVCGLSAGLLALGAVLIWREKPVPKPRLGYTQLTDFTDSVVAPVLSPDGRMLAFIRGTNWFLSLDQIWLKLLPDGEPVPLTHDLRPKFAPAFSPDGSQLAYSVVDPFRAAWDTVSVPVLGGEPHLLMQNAEGLTWVGAHRFLFSELKTGIHMAVVTARDNRSEARDVYVPEHERAMAHFSYASPDHAWVLVIEMDHTVAWQPCRLVPFDGSSRGRVVGPPGRCTSAGWSPDGKWMYFTVATTHGQHLWRQRFPGGAPEQLTFGPVGEAGVAVAPDGRSIITSVGIEQSAIWIHDARGERPISSFGNASLPRFSANGKRVYFLLRRGTPDSESELWGTDPHSGRSERLVNGFPITSFDVSDDGSEVVFAAKPARGKSQIWLASLDRRSRPVRITSGGEETPNFGPEGQILFRASDGKDNYLLRMNRDGSGRARVVPFPIGNVMSVSPDRLWAAALVPVDDALAPSAELAIPVKGGEARRICSGFCVARWAPNGEFLYLTLEVGAGFHPRKTVAMPLPPGKALPELPAEGIRSVSEALAIPGGRVIEQSELAPGLDPSVYAYVKVATHRNLFRIPLP